jgi:transposase-like protein
MNKTSPATRERWRRIIEQQKRSGLSIARFCREQGVAESSLFTWKRRLAGDTQAAAGAAFVLLKPAPAPEGETPLRSLDGAIELHLGQGRRLVLRPGFDPATLAAALAVLRGDGAGTEVH